MLRWVIQYGAIVIPKSVSRKRILENAQIFDPDFVLDESDMAALAKLDDPKKNRIYNDPTHMP